MIKSFLKSLLVLPDLIVLTLRRLRSRPQLTLLALVGVVLAVGLLSSTAFFSQAVDRTILQQELAELSRVTGRHPFAIRVYSFPSTRKPMSVTDAETLARDVEGALAGEIGLPVGRRGLFVESSGLMLLPAENDAKYGNGSSNAFLKQVTLDYIDGVGDHIEITSGDQFVDAQPSGGEVLDVWMHAGLAEEMGVRAGESFRVTVNLSRTPRQVRVRGLWQATAMDKAFWFNNPDQQMRTVLLVQRAAYISFVEPMLPGKTGAVFWTMTLDDGPMNPAYAPQYATGFEKGMSIINQFLPDARLDISALDPLTQFVRRQAALTTTLLSFNVPALGFLLAFLVLIALILGAWQRRETAVLVSRGMSMTTVLGLTVLEEIVLYVIGVPLGIACGMGLARLMGNTVSFLTFQQRAEFPVSLQGLNWWLVLLALGVALLARLLPTIQAARQSVVVQEREGARPLRAPWWQRVYLDFLLLAPTYYAYQQLAGRGTLARLVEDKPEELFQDPLLILLPALVVFCAALLSMRLFTLIVRLIDLAARWTSWTPFHLALRQLGRYGHGYTNALLLMIVSLALGIYTSSLAASLDQWLVDRIYYGVGSDISFLPYIEAAGATGGSGGAGEEAEVDTAWIPTNAEFTELEGVQQVGRVGQYRARIGMGSDQEVRGYFLGVDRAEFPTVAWFRPDFAPESLGALMNRLAAADDGILVPERYLAETHHNIGDTVQIGVTVDDGLTIPGLFKIAGIYRYFPTVFDEADPEQGITVIGNLEQVFLIAGATFPYHVWLRMDPQRLDGRDPATAQQEFFRAVEANTGVKAAQQRDAQALIAAEQAKFERVGIFGTLSVGFLAAAGMAALALLIYSYASLQDRLYQFGVLRAIGLYKGQVLTQVIIEYLLLILFGVASGWWIGAATSQLFSPFFRVGGQPGIPLPPLIPVIPQEQITALALLFAGVMILIELAVILRALSSRLFSALRIGHQG